MVKESASTIHFDDLSVCLSVCPSVHLAFHMSISLYVALSIFSWSVDLPINLSVRLPV